MSEELYQARILDHAKAPRNKRAMPDASCVEKGSNPSCGDRIVLYVRLAEGVVQDASFEGEGCAISTAAASLLTERLRGMSIEKAQALTDQDVYDVLGVAVGPGREKCALLAWRAMRACFEKFQVPSPHTH